MRTKKGFNLRSICGENILVAEGIENIDFSNIISMNESSAWLWQQVQGKDFDAQTLAELLTQEYEVDMETALADTQQLLGLWQKAGIVE